MVDVNGDELESLTLPDVPIQPLTVTDWNFDGLNDVILMSRTGVYGWVQIRRPQSTSYSMLVAALVVVLVIVYATNWQSEEGIAAYTRKGRSTDQIM